MRARTAARLAWTLWGLFAAGLGSLFILGHVNGSPITLVDVTQLLAFAAMMTVVALVASRRPENPIGWIYCGIALFFLLAGPLADGYATYALVTRPGSLPGGQLTEWSTNWAFFPVIGMLFTFSLLLFPDGRLPSPRWRPVAWGGVAAIVVGSLGFALSSADYTDINGNPASNPFAVDGLTDVFNVLKNVGGLMLVAIALLCAVSVILRFRRSRSEEREQLKWLVYAGALNALFLITTGWIDLGNGNFLDVVFGVLIALIPTSAGIAILKYRLYDIDVVINKTVVYGALALFITAVYVAIVVGIGSLVGRGGEPNVALSILATALVAVAFQPVRVRVQRFANRLVYGERASPYDVLSGFSERVAGTYATEDVLPRTARVVAEGTGAARAEIWLRIDSELVEAASWPGDGQRDRRLTLPNGSLPEIDDVDRTVPVRYQGELLGALTVTKPAGERLTPAEEKLLTDLASQAGSVLRNVGLTSELRARLEQLSAQAEELRASRQRIVAAHDAERRRLERNIHDGAQQHLVALAVKLRLAKAAAAKDPDKARHMLEELRAETVEALETLTDLSRGIYPPVLEEHGIVAALEAQGRSSNVPLRIASDGVGRYAIEAGAAVYFCCLEALQNAAKYAAASAIEIHLNGSRDELAFSVIDDGSGFDPAATGGGSGLQNMRDRAAAIGGSVGITSSPGRGTTVSGRIPVPSMEAVR